MLSSSQVKIHSDGEDLRTGTGLEALNDVLLEALPSGAKVSCAVQCSREIGKINSLNGSE